jgi:hypothetical protein
MKRVRGSAHNARAPGIAWQEGGAATAGPAAAKVSATINALMRRR